MHTGKFKTIFREFRFIFFLFLCHIGCQRFLVFQFFVTLCVKKSLRKSAVISKNILNLVEVLFEKYEGAIDGFSMKMFCFCFIRLGLLKRRLSYWFVCFGDVIENCVLETCLSIIHQVTRWKNIKRHFCISREFFLQKRILQLKRVSQGVIISF